MSICPQRGWTSFILFSPIEHSLFLVPPWARYFIFFFIFADGQTASLCWWGVRSSEMYSTCQNKAEGAVGMDPASHILSKDSGWKNVKIQQCLSFTCRIVNLRILILCPAPTRLKFCEGAVLLLRDGSSLPTSMRHLGHRAWQIFFSQMCFLSWKLESNHFPLLLACVAQLGPGSSGLCPNVFWTSLQKLASRRPPSYLH